MATLREAARNNSLDPACLNSRRATATHHFSDVNLQDCDVESQSIRFPLMMKYTVASTEWEAGSG